MMSFYALTVADVLLLVVGVFAVGLLVGFSAGVVLMAYRTTKP